jgi:hypothetical protein
MDYATQTESNAGKCYFTRFAVDVQPQTYGESATFRRSGFSVDIGELGRSHDAVGEKFKKTPISKATGCAEISSLVPVALPGRYEQSFDGSILA